MECSSYVVRRPGGLFWCKNKRREIPTENFVRGMVAQWEAWWLNGSAPDCCPAVLGSNPVSPQPTADCQSPDGLPPGMALGWGLISVRGDRGENHEKMNRWFAKNI